MKRPTLQAAYEFALAKREAALDVLERTTLSARMREREADAIAWRALVAARNGVKR